MAITATYISSTSFSVATDLRSYFIPGRALKMDCGADGIKFGFVDYSAYTSVTTVNLLASESQAITSNLASVEISSVKPGSANTGCTALESLLMLRGFKAGMVLSYKDADEFYIDAGSIHIDDGTYERIYTVPSQLTKSVTGLSNSTWYHIYANPPANGLVLTAAEITYSTTAPSVDVTKGGKLYHPSDGTKRCIGWVYSNSSSNIFPFFIHSGCYFGEDAIATDVGGATPSGTWTGYTLTVPIGSLSVVAGLVLIYSNANANAYARRSGSAGSVLRDLGYVHSSQEIRADFQVTVNCGTDKKIELKWSTTTTNPIYLFTMGFYLPSSL